MIHVIVLGLVAAAFVLGYLIGTPTILRGDARADQRPMLKVPRWVLPNPGQYQVGDVIENSHSGERVEVI